MRLIGIDTPELSGRECYAQQAASAMQSLVQSKSVRLVRDPSQADRDRYDRLLRHVALVDGRHVAQILTTKACLIKGNIARDGEKIYHLPGQRYYDVTKISESKGERWFCSESQARDAGWRPAEL